MSFDKAVQVLTHDSVVAVVTTRSDGRLTATPIWAMVVDGVPYLRSVFGEKAAWFRHILAGGPVSIVLGDGALAETDPAGALDLPRQQVRVTRLAADDPVQERIDAEVHRKYTDSPHPLDTMFTATARTCTLRVAAAN